MKLIHKKTGVEVNIGDVVESFICGKSVVTGFMRPHKPSSEGKVFVKSKSDHGRWSEYYVSAFGMEWIEREDRIEPKANPPEKIWVLSIESGFGICTSAYRQKSSAEDYLWKYVCQYWQKHGPAGDLDTEATGKERDKFIEDYFVWSGDDYGLEEVDIEN